MVEEALRSNIRQCVAQLCRAVSGDSRTPPSPLFKVLVTLRQAAPNSTPKVPQHSPGTQPGFLCPSHTSPTFNILMHSRKCVSVAEQLEFSPSLRNLEKNVDMLPQLISTISEFKRLPEMISSRRSQERPIHGSIGLCLQHTHTDTHLHFSQIGPLTAGEHRRGRGRGSQLGSFTIQKTRLTLDP